MRRPAVLPLLPLLAATGPVSAGALLEGISRPFYPWEPEGEKSEAAPVARAGARSAGTVCKKDCDVSQDSSVHRRGPALALAQSLGGDGSVADAAFPAELRHYKFVAGASQSSEVLGATMKLFDLALYLDEGSDLWNQEISPPVLAERARGASMLRLKVTGGLMNAKRLAHYIDKKVRPRVLKVDANANMDVDKLVHLASKARDLSLGSVVDIFVTDAGLRVLLDGRELGEEVVGQKVAEALLGAFVQDLPDIAGLQDGALKDLHPRWSLAQRSVQSDPIKAHRKSKLMIAVVGAAGFFAFLSFGHCLRTRAVRAHKGGQAEPA
uniref:Uncharacterized protein n=1 Tax=Alexandrium catenella TaxID=2925 RepID=A0A7S1PQK3_ALECA|mmetsp:Transcript_107738/g.286795  ORF Transcript_107738/g.286795 Transcript_107738/m.286795 type:complete len:324 (+) Transcript_107738:67-1038(+)